MSTTLGKKFLIDSPARYPRSACFLLWLNFPAESLCQDFQEITYFNFSYLKALQMSFGEKIHSTFQKGCIWDSQAHLSLFLLPSHFWKPKLQEKERCGPAFRFHDKQLLPYYKIVNEIHPASFQWSQSWTALFSKKPSLSQIAVKVLFLPLLPHVQ